MSALSASEVRVEAARVVQSRGVNAVFEQGSDLFEDEPWDWASKDAVLVEVLRLSRGAA